MEARARTWFTERGIAIDGGDEIDLFAGSMHYWRVHQDRWRDDLKAMAELGLTAVTTYVPWSVHEEAPGRMRFDRHRDLGAFLDHIADVGLSAIVRPGPHINAELTGFGYPDRILRDRRNLAVSGRGTPVWLPAPPKMFPVPSYASSHFRSQVRQWFAAVADIVRPRLAPDGPVVAIQVDNEMQMFFRAAAFDHDYHPDAIAWWRESAGEDPPRTFDPERTELCLRWVRFKEEYVARSLSWVREELAGVGLGDVALFHNAPPSEPDLVNLPAMARAAGGLAGMDFYHRASDYGAVRDRGLYLTGSGLPLPFAPELGTGGALWIPLMSEEDQRNVILGLLATGCRAFNLYMVVDRERWYGAPLAGDGSRRELAGFIERLLTVLRQVEWTSLRRDCVAAVVLSRADARAALATSVVDPMSPIVSELLGLGPAGFAELAQDASARPARRAGRALRQALDLAEIPYLIVDEELLDQLPASVRLVVMPTVDRADPDTWKALADRLASGVRVVIGPSVPSRDTLDRPTAFATPKGLGILGPESLDKIDGLADDLLALVGDLPDEWIAPNQPGVDCSLFRDAGGRPVVLFVGNREGDAVRAEVALADDLVLVDAFTDEVIAGDSGSVAAVELASHQVRMFLVRKAE